DALVATREETVVLLAKSLQLALTAIQRAGRFAGEERRMALHDPAEALGVAVALPFAAIERRIALRPHEERRLEHRGASAGLKHPQPQLVSLEAGQALVEPAQRFPGRASKDRGAVDRIGIGDEGIEIRGVRRENPCLVSRAKDPDR